MKQDPVIPLKNLYFDGITYIEALDQDRLKTALQKVFVLMLDGQPRTLAEIAQKVGTSEAGASARLRDLRKERFGGHTVRSSRRMKGLWEYRLIARWSVSTITEQPSLFEGDRHAEVQN